MTSIHGALRDLLLADNTVMGLTSNRIYPLRLPLDCPLPAISIHKISGHKDHLIGHGTPRYQVSCWAESFATAQTLSEAVINYLVRYKGIASGNHIKQIVYENSLDAIEDETGLFHVPVDFKIIHI